MKREIGFKERGDVFVQDIVNNLEMNEYSEILDNYYSEEIALAIHLGLTIDEMEEIEDLGDNEYKYGGIRYFVGTYEEGEEKARRYLENDDCLWKEAIQSGRTTVGFDDWIDGIISTDGVGSILNKWNGSEEYVNVNGIEYLICRL